MVRVIFHQAASPPSTGWFKGRGQGGYSPLPRNLAPNKFYERPFDASRMQENLLAAEDWGAYCTPQTRSWWGGRWLPPSQGPNPAISPLGLGLWLFGPHPRHEIGDFPNMMGCIRLCSCTRIQLCSPVGDMAHSGLTHGSFGSFESTPRKMHLDRFIT